MNRPNQENWRVSSSTLPGLTGFSCRSVPRLPAGEGERFLKAWRLLGSGGILALTRDGDMALSGAGVCEALLARSWSSRYHDPGAMLRLASAAREVSLGLKTKDLGKAAVAAMRARTLGEVANALRIAGDATGAHDAFEEAFDLEDEHGDRYLTAHLLHMRATLYGSAGDPGIAAQLLELVNGFYDGMGERHLGGRARITRSIYTARAGRNEAALQLNGEGLELLDSEREPALLMTALHNRLLLLLSLGWKEEARKTLAHCGGFDSAGPVAMRLRWAEGRILHALGELEDAEAALRQSRDGLSALGLPLFTAMASLDLASTLLLQNRFHDAQAEALTAQRILLGLGNRQKYLAVLLVLEAAFTTGGATAELVERALTLLRSREAGNQVYPTGS